jgi:hypothetical protein
MRDLFILFGLAFIPVTATLFVLWRTARSRARRAEKLVDQLAGTTPSRRDATDTDMTRIRNALESLALDVDRLAEAQRFTSEILAKRRNAAVNKLPRVNTPH